MAFVREQMKQKAAALAAQGVFIGTSSWKYEGWMGQIYTPSRYEYRGKIAISRFERDCLSEYAEVFKTVCVDAAYYTFPRVEYLHKLADAVPDDFRFGFKVTDAVTLKKFHNLNRFGAKAGKPNPDFLNSDLFATAFLKPCEAIRPKVGILMFEFAHFWPTDYEHGREFVSDLDTFLGKLPKGWPYAIEMRNKLWLRDEYFDCLTRHGVTHVFNSWDAMPPVSEQMALPASRTSPNLTAARFLLKPGRKYEEAVKTFQPYDKVKEQYPDARAAGKSLPADGMITVCEPACGSGAMILSLAEACSPEVRRRLRVTAMDINRTACDMAFINTTLWGVPTRIIHGNTLSMECWAAWSNIHYIMPWLPLALRIQTPEAMEQGQPPKPAEVERMKVSLTQQELAF